MSLAPFSEVVALHGPTVLKVCRSMLSTSEADDAWSDTFLSAMRAHPDLDEEANVAAWLVTIARRKAIDVVRRRERTAIPVADATDAATEPAVSVSIADDEMRNALRQLSDRQRTAVVAHHVVGLPYGEVAELLDTIPRSGSSLRD